MTKEDYINIIFNNQFYEPQEVSSAIESLKQDFNEMVLSLRISIKQNKKNPKLYVRYINIPIPDKIETLLNSARNCTKAIIENEAIPESEVISFEILSDEYLSYPEFIEISREFPYNTSEESNV